MSIGNSGSGTAAGASSGSSPRGYSQLPDLVGRLRRSAIIILLLSPIGILLVSVTRLLIVSDFNPATASAIASSGGYVDTVLGTVIPLISIVMPYLALALFFFNRVILGLLASLMVIFATPMVVTRPAADSLITTYVHAVFDNHPTIFYFLAIPMTAAIIFLLFVEFTGLGVSVFMRTVAIVACIVLLPLTSKLYPFPSKNPSYTDIIRTPWLPAENISLNNGQKIVGYVLSDDGNWTTVLTETSRKIVYYPADTIKLRSICEVGKVASLPPLIPLLYTKSSTISSTPACFKSPSGQPRRQTPFLPNKIYRGLFVN